MSQSPSNAAEHQTDRNLALELVRVTEAAALAASRWMGRGNKNEADGAAVEAMRHAFDAVAIDGTVVIGEGEMDEAPMLYIGEKVGYGGPAHGHRGGPAGRHHRHRQGRRQRASPSLPSPNAGNFLHAPDIYMDKIAVGAPACPPAWSTWTPPRCENLRNLARAKQRDIERPGRLHPRTRSPRTTSSPTAAKPAPASC